MFRRYQPGLFALLLLGGTAHSQSMSPLNPASEIQGGVSGSQNPAKQLPPGIPGYFVPATGEFTPLELPSAAFAALTGVITLDVSLYLREDYDDITGKCTVTLAFGNETLGGFFTNHFENKSFNFSSVNTTVFFRLPYSYTPTSDNVRVTIIVACDGYADTGERVVHHRGNDTLSDKPVKSANYDSDIAF